MDKKEKTILDNNQRTSITKFDKLAYLLSENPYILAAGWIFTVIGGIIAIYTINAFAGMVIIVLFSVFLIVIPKRVLAWEEPVTVKETTKVPGDRTSATLNTDIPAPIDLVGREKDIQDIYSLLEENSIVSIKVDGGVGKTVVAARIANDIKNKIASNETTYEHIAWIHSTENLESDLTSLDIPTFGVVKSQDEKLRELKIFLQNTPTFLVIDNMDEPPKKNENYLLNTITGKTKILITTRADISLSKKYELEDLDPDSSLVFFYRHYKKDKRITIDQIRNMEDVPYAEKSRVLVLSNNSDTSIYCKKEKDDIFGNTSDIHGVVSRHVECICLLDKKKPKDYVKIGVDAEDYYRIKDSEKWR